jgi:hypothetical protein
MLARSGKQHQHTCKTGLPETFVAENYKRFFMLISAFWKGVLVIVPSLHLLNSIAAIAYNIV